jgi:hypothetical protein
MMTGVLVITPIEAHLLRRITAAGARVRLLDAPAQRTPDSVPSSVR